MKMTWKTAKRKLACIGLAAIMVFCTGCGKPATTESIAEGKKVDMRIDLDQIPTPETAGMYNYTKSFSESIDPDELAALLFDGQPVARTEGPSGIDYRLAEGYTARLRFSMSNQPDKFVDGKWTAPVSEAKLITFARENSWNVETEYGGSALSNFTRFGFAEEQGNIGTIMAESGADDPKMAAALAKSRAIMEYMNYDGYREVVANKYSKEKLAEMFRLLGGYGKIPGYNIIDDVTGAVTEVPPKDVVIDTELYCIRFNIIPDTLPKDVDTSRIQYFLCAIFLFDKDGLVMVSLPSQPEFTPVQEGPACSARTAFEASLGEEKWTEATLHSIHYTMKSIGDTQYIGIWELHYTRDPVVPISAEEQKQLDEIGAKGKKERFSLYVNALSGVKLDRTFDQGVDINVFPVVLNKYNAPELYE